MFKRAILVDYENVCNEGLAYVDKLTEENKVVIFFSKNANHMTFQTHQKLMESKADIEYLEVTVGGRNALDIQLATYLGFLAGRNEAEEYFIISKDNGFKYVETFVGQKLQMQVNCKTFIGKHFVDEKIEERESDIEDDREEIIEAEQMQEVEEAQEIQEVEEIREIEEVQEIQKVEEVEAIQEIEEIQAVEVIEEAEEMKELDEDLESPSEQKKEAKEADELLEELPKELSKELQEEQIVAKEMEPLIEIKNWDEPEVQEKDTKERTDIKEIKETKESNAEKNSKIQERKETAKIEAELFIFNGKEFLREETSTLAVQALEVPEGEKKTSKKEHKKENKKVEKENKQEVQMVELEQPALMDQPEEKDSLPQEAKTKNKKKNSEGEKKTKNSKKLKKDEPFFLDEKAVEQAIQEAHEAYRDKKLKTDVMMNFIKTGQKKALYNMLRGKLGQTDGQKVYNNLKQYMGESA